MRRPGVLALLLLVAVSQAVLAQQPEVDHELSPDGDWFSVLNGDGLKPGDVVVMKPGVYSDVRRLEMSHRGTKEKGISIFAQQGAVLQRPDAKQNSINIAGCQYLAIYGLEITGGSAAIRIGKKGSRMAKFLTFANLHIHHIGGVAITANNEGNTYEGLVFRGNHIHHTGGHGEAFYLGCNNRNDGSTPGYVFNSIVEGNYIHHLNGPNVSQGDGIEIKDGSYANIIRDNVIHDTKYPGITVYGTDGKERNLIERNVIWKTGDNGIQAAADAIIRNNIVFDAGGAGIYSRNHQSAVVGNLMILHNTVVNKGKTALRIVPPGGTGFSGPISVGNNALYGAIAIQAGPGGPLDIVGNAGSGEIVGLGKLTPGQWQGGGNADVDFAEGEKNFYPSSRSYLLGKAARKNLAEDFNGTKRTGTIDVGAYRYDAGGNPGWEVQEGFKSKPPAKPKE